MLWFINISSVIRVLYTHVLKLYIVISGGEYCKSKWCIDCLWFFMCVSIVGWYASFFGKKPFVFEVSISNGFEVYDFWNILYVDTWWWSLKLKEVKVWNMKYGHRARNKESCEWPNEPRKYCRCEWLEITNENSYNVKDVEVSIIVFMIFLFANQIKTIFGRIISNTEEGWVIRPTPETTRAGVGVDWDYSPYLGWN